MTVPSLTVNHDPDDAGNTAWDSPTTVVTLDAVTKRYRNAHVLNDVTLRLDGPRIHGLLGRNGAGKTTLLRILAGQALATAGTVHVFDDAPYENRKVLRRTATITEGQRYPDAYSVASVLTAARLHYPRWDDALAHVVSEIQRIQATYGDDAFAMLSGVSLTNEKSYLVGKFARLALHTANLDYNGRFCMVSAGAGNKKAFGIDRAAN